MSRSKAKPTAKAAADAAPLAPAGTASGSGTAAAPAKAPTRAQRRAAAAEARKAPGTTETTATKSAPVPEPEPGSPGVAATDKPKAPDGLGTQQSHEAQTTAERTLATAGATDAGALNPPVTGPIVKDEANPPVHNPLEGAANLIDNGQSESRQDESGDIQNATAQGIGAGGGAPDGIVADEAAEGTDEANPPAASIAEDDENTVVINDDLKFQGNKGVLWKLLEKGVTNQQMLDATGMHSVLGTINVMARAAERELEVEKDKKTGERTYKLAALPEKPAA